MLSDFRHANCLDLVERSFAALTKVTRLSVRACAKLHWGRSVFYGQKTSTTLYSEENKLWQQLIASSHSWGLARSRLNQSVIPSSKTRRAKKSSTGSFSKSLRPTFAGATSISITAASRLPRE